MTGQLSGDERRSRIEDLATGNRSQEELAEKYGISLQTMREFSARNADEVAARKRELHAELHAESAARWVADKDEILAYYEMMLDRLRPKFATSEVDSPGWARLSRNAQKLLHDCSELGDFPQARQRVELEVSNAELPAVGTKWLQVAPDVSAADS